VSDATTSQKTPKVQGKRRDFEPWKEASTKSRKKWKKKPFRGGEAKRESLSYHRRSAGLPLSGKAPPKGEKEGTVESS